MRMIDADALYAALMEKSTVIARGTGRNCLALACKAVAAMVQDAPTIIEVVDECPSDWDSPLDEIYDEIYDESEEVSDETD